LGLDWKAKRERARAAQSSMAPFPLDSLESYVQPTRHRARTGA
jgi:hypothetical protein